MKRMFVSLAVALLVGCAGDQVSVIEKVDQVDTLSLQSVNLSDEILMPLKMISSDGKLIIMQAAGDEVFVALDNPSSGNSRVIGLKGRGPLEFLNVDVQSFQPIDGGFICIDEGGIVKRVRLSDEISITTEIIDTHGNPRNGILMNDSYITANMNGSESEFIRYTKGADDYVTFQPYPEWIENTELTLPLVYVKNMVAHPTEDKFAAFYAYFRKCRIIKTNGVILNDIDVRIPEDFPDYSLEPLTRSLAYASYPCASEKYIYALCHNEQMLSLSKSIPEIHIWDWYGNLKARVVLDRHIDIFTVDETKGLIYAMDINNSNVLYYQNYSLN